MNGRNQFALTLMASTLPALLLLACSRSGEREPEMRPASGALSGPPDGTESLVQGVEAISSARCDRELRCGGIGPDERYASRGECVGKFGRDAADTLNADACPRGLDATQLSKCLSEIDSEECGSPLDSLERLVACRSGALCQR